MYDSLRKWPWNNVILTNYLIKYVDKRKELQVFLIIYEIYKLAWTLDFTSVYFSRTTNDTRN